MMLNIILLIFGLSTPNKELAKLRGCKERDCLWVWSHKRLGNMLMIKRAAKEMAVQKNECL